MSGERIFFNGINGATGKYLMPPLYPLEVAKLGRARRTSEEGLGAYDRDPISDCDARDLAQTGWGVVWGPGTPPEVRQALSKLLEHRQGQATKRQEAYFRQYDYQAGETASQFLVRHNVKPGAMADADRMPYYLLLVGDPESIPFSFQCEMDACFAVGRLCFKETGDYERYAWSVKEAEGGSLRPRKVTLFGVRNDGDTSTERTSQELIDPLSRVLTGPALPDWEVRQRIGGQADKAGLAQILGGAETPALLFTASHGVGFPWDDRRQTDKQGGLVCQDWPGPEKGPVRREHYFTAEDLSDGASVHGLVAFLFACYSAGTPNRDNFDRETPGRARKIATRPFISRLAQRLLAHPNGGALAVIGHVDRAWTTSFEGSSAGEGVDLFRNTLRRLLSGHTVGWAMEHFNYAYAMLSAELSNLWEKEHFWEEVDPGHFARIWLAHNDARNFVILGDPAVRLAVGEE